MQQLEQKVEISIPGYVMKKPIQGICAQEGERYYLHSSEIDEFTLGEGTTPEAAIGSLGEKFARILLSRDTNRNAAMIRNRLYAYIETERLVR